MKYILPIALALLATGCTTVPVTAKFPEIPEIIIQACPNLKQIETETAPLSEISKTITQKYTTYYECAVKVDAFTKWYQTQKAIFESIK